MAASGWSSGRRTSSGLRSRPYVSRGIGCSASTASNATSACGFKRHVPCQDSVLLPSNYLNCQAWWDLEETTRILICSPAPTCTAVLSESPRM